MSVSVTVHLWWFLPLLVTIASIYWVQWMTKGDTGLFAGIGIALCSVPALFVSMVAWIIGAICK